MLKLLPFVLAALSLAAPAPAQQTFDVDGPMELHILFTAKDGQEAELEKTFREVFFPAVSSMPGFREAALLREAETSDYVIRLAFQSEKQRLAWVASDKHQRAWPAVEKLVTDVGLMGAAVIHPR